MSDKLELAHLYTIKTYPLSLLLESNVVKSIKSNVFYIKIYTIRIDKKGTLYFAIHKEFSGFCFG